MPANQPTRSSAPAMHLLSRFMVEVPKLRSLMAELAHDQLYERGIVEHLSRALWGIFSHHRAVLDRAGRHVDLGSWRAAAELIADTANRHYPRLNPAIRYMDCYMGVLLGDERRAAARPLYRWIFTVLRDAGCDWVYSYDAELSSAERRIRVREVSAVMRRAYINSEQHVHAPLPPVVAAYEDVYGRLPDGWPL